MVGCTSHGSLTYTPPYYKSRGRLIPESFSPQKFPVIASSRMRHPWVTDNSLGTEIRQIVGVFPLGSTFCPFGCKRSQHPCCVLSWTGRVRHPHLPKSIDNPDVSTLRSLSEALAETDGPVRTDATAAPVVPEGEVSNSLETKGLRLSRSGSSD